MNKNEFIKAVNLMIDARLKKIVPVLVKKEMESMRKQWKKEVEEGTFELPEDIEESTLASALKEDVIFSREPERKVVKSNKPPRVFTKNAQLNAILQQTAEEVQTGNGRSAADDSEYVSQYKQILAEQYGQAGVDDMETMNFNSSNISQLAARSSIPPEVNNKIALEIGKRQIEAVTGNEELGGLIMRDYRALMKKVDEKSKTIRPVGV